MGGNDAENIQVLFSTSYLPWCGGWGSPSCRSTGDFLVSDDHEDGCGDEDTDDPDDIPTWGCLMVIGAGNRGWLAEEDPQEAGPDNPEGVWWVPEPQGW